MKICKSALDATVEQFRYQYDSPASIEEIIQAYSERLPDLVGILGMLLRNEKLDEDDEELIKTRMIAAGFILQMGN